LINDVLKPKDIDQIISDIGNPYTLIKVLTNMLKYHYDENKEMLVSVIGHKEFFSYVVSKKVFEESCALGHFEVIEAILKRDLINPADNNNFGLRQAYSNNHLKIVNLLIKHPKVQSILSKQQFEHLTYMVSKNERTDNIIWSWSQ
jgi:hypothetical protein